MRYHVLACDYDGTLALHGRVDARTVAALDRLLATGRKLVLVTGRELGELLAIFPELDRFAYVVAENGALLYQPGTKKEELLTSAPPPELIAHLQSRGVTPMSVGRAIIATWQPHETVVLQTIQELGLEMQVIFNKGAVMVLPSGVNKATGLTAALNALELSPHEAVGVGDAENDHAFLSLCECGVAVANALPALKEHADLQTRGDHGSGVAELIDLLVANDLADLAERLTRHHLLLGQDPSGVEVTLPAYGCNVLIAGPSGSGKSTAAASFLERLAEQKYQYCIIDPEGDYGNHPDAVTLGNTQHAPAADEVVQLLKAPPWKHVVANLIGLPINERPPFFITLWTRLQELQAKTGRPHWLVIDETHHLLPASWQPAAKVVPPALNRTMFITVHPEHVAPAVLAAVDLVIAVGEHPEATVSRFNVAVGEPPVASTDRRLQAGEVWLWSRSDRVGRRVRLVPSRAEHQRHVRKYAEGELSPQDSFYFRGPKNQLNLRAQNLFLFLQIADGVDDPTWLHHLHRGDYSRWFRAVIKDKSLADEAAAIESQRDLSPAKSRAQMRALVERLYTLPAAPPLPVPET